MLCYTGLLVHRHKSQAAATAAQSGVMVSHSSQPTIPACSTTRKGVSLWQNESRSAGKGGVSAPHQRDADEARLPQGTVGFLEKERRQRLPKDKSKGQRAFPCGLLLTSTASAVWPSAPSRRRDVILMTPPVYPC